MKNEKLTRNELINLVVHQETRYLEVYGNLPPLSATIGVKSKLKSVYTTVELSKSELTKLKSHNIDIIKNLSKKKEYFDFVTIHTKGLSLEASDTLIEHVFKNLLDESGYILMFDTYPKSEKEAEIEGRRGLGYQMLMQFRAKHPHINILTLDLSYPLTLIKKASGDDNRETLPEILNYHSFQERASEFVQLGSPMDLLKFLKSDNSAFPKTYCVNALPIINMLLKFTKLSELSALSYSDATILPVISVKEGSGPNVLYGGVLNKTGDFVAGWKRKKIANESKVSLSSYQQVLSGYKFEKEDCDYINEDVIFGGIYRNHFGDFQFYNMVRLWYVFENSKDNRKVAILLRDEMTGWMRTFFELLGIYDRLIIITQPTRFKSVTVPEQGVYDMDCLFAEEMKLPFEHIRSKIIEIGKEKKLLTFNKIYLSQSKSLKQLIGEEIIEKYFTDNGFIILNPEDFTLEQQLYFISNANEIASSGATLIETAAAYSKENAKLIFTKRTLAIHPMIDYLVFFNRDLSIIDVDISPIPTTWNSSVSMIGISQELATYTVDRGWPFKTLNQETSDINQYFIELMNWIQKPTDGIKRSFMKQLDLFKIFEGLADYYDINFDSAQWKKYIK